MLLPIGHEQSTLKRPPILTIAFILLNIVAFLLTRGDLHRDTPADLATVKSHILVLKARNSDLTVNPQVQRMIDEFRSSKPQAWTALLDDNRQPADAWETAHLLDPDRTSQRLQQDMDFLSNQFLTLQTSDSSTLTRFAYRSYHPTLQSYLTSDFLNTGWLHLFVNLYALWLCGLIVEDLLGPLAVLGIYLVAGAVAVTLHGWTTPNSFVPIVGSSAAIAGLMGAMLARYPKLNLRLAYPWFNPLRIDILLAPVYVLVAGWLLVEWFFEVAAKGLAQSTYLPGFVFGGAVGLIFYAVKPRPVIDFQPATSSGPDEKIMRAQSLLDRFDPESCILELRHFLKRKPDSLEAWQLLLRAQDSVRDYASQRDETIPNLVRLSFANGETAQAIRYVERYRNIGGSLVPAEVWLELGQKYERQHLWEAAVNEYEQLGYFYYEFHEASLTALTNAARIYCHELKRPIKAERLYRIAQGSPIAHLHLDAVIDQGLLECANSPYYVTRAAAHAH